MQLLVEVCVGRLIHATRQTGRRGDTGRRSWPRSCLAAGRAALAAAGAAGCACFLLAERAILAQQAGGVEVAAHVIRQAAEGAVEGDGGEIGAAVGPMPSSSEASRAIVCSSARSSSRSTH